MNTLTRKTSCPCPELKTDSSVIQFLAQYQYSPSYSVSHTNFLLSHTHTHTHIIFFFFFFYLGPVSLSSGSISALRLILQTLNCHSAQTQYPCVSYKETEVPEWGCAYIFWFNKQLPKDVAVLTSQCLTAAGDVLHCFSLHLAESAGWISTKQA